MDAGSGYPSTIVEIDQARGRRASRSSRDQNATANVINVREDRAIRKSRIIPGGGWRRIAASLQPLLLMARRENKCRGE